MKLKIREKLEVLVDHYPNYTSLNPKLMEDVKRADYSLSYKTNIYGKHSNWNTKTDNIKFITDWVYWILNQNYGLIKNGYEHRLNFYETWFAIYDKGEYAKEHLHELSVWSFVYFINCPKGSSPLVFSSSGRRMKAEEGKIVIFPGHLRHHVPKNGCNGRIVLAGNCLQDQTPIDCHFIQSSEEEFVKNGGIMNV